MSSQGLDRLSTFGLRAVPHPPTTTSGKLKYTTVDQTTGTRVEHALDFRRSREQPPRQTLAKVAPGRGDDTLTFLRCAPGARAAKQVTVDATSVTPDPSTWSFKVEDYDCGAVFVGLVEVEISNVHELAFWLQHAAQDRRTLLIRGSALPDAMPPLLRRGEGAHEHSTFRDVPRRWAMIDLDDKAKFARHFDLTADPETAVRAALSQLPLFLQRATCVWQLSGTAWLRGVRMHLFFWFDRPVSNKELSHALADYPVDRSVFRCVQPHYIANPIFVGVEDPLPRRWGVLAGGVE